MILEDLKKALPEYTIVNISENEYQDLFELQQTNPYYFMTEQDHPITLEESIAGVKDLPPNTTYEQKYYIGFYREHKLEAIMDYIEGFPNPGIVWIGLFMIHGTKSRTGIGSHIIHAFIEVLRLNQVEKLQLGCIVENEKALPFWVAMGLHEIRRAVSKAEGRKDWDVIVMERAVTA